MVKYEVLTGRYVDRDGSKSEYSVIPDPINGKKWHDTLEEAQAECDKLNKEQEMEDISKKFHDGMHVRLCNGVEIKGLVFSNGWWRIKDSPSTTTLWFRSGLFLAPGVETLLDIVEVLSTPPKKLVKDVELKPGMMIVSCKSGIEWEVLGVHEGAAWLKDSYSRSSTVFSASEIKNWEVVDANQ